ncbi:MAG: hypothetical protein MUF00_06855 [Gemmatimonadaceae bacterium]|nr:hypothetical protein [Gemmatimonadaceae bacterium]
MAGAEVVRRVRRWHVCWIGLGLAPAVACAQADTTPRTVRVWAEVGLGLLGGRSWYRGPLVIPDASSLWRQRSRHLYPRVGATATVGPVGVGVAVFNVNEQSPLGGGDAGIPRFHGYDTFGEWRQRVGAQRIGVRLGARRLVGNSFFTPARDPFAFGALLWEPPNSGVVGWQVTLDYSRTGWVPGGELLRQAEERRQLLGLRIDWVIGRR